MITDVINYERNIDWILEIKESRSIGVIIISPAFRPGEAIIISVATSNADKKSTFVSVFKTLMCV